MIELLNIDCMEYMKDVPDKYFDLCVTDPPYGVNLDYNTYDDSLGNWKFLMTKFIPEIKRVSKMAIFPSCSINKMEWIYKYIPPDWLICWHKGSPGHSSYVGFNDYEPILVYGKLKGLQMHDYFSLNNDEKMGNYGHPCPKPIKWYKMFIARISKTVTINTMIDPFLGSGTGAIAAFDFGIAEFVGCEIDKEYYDAAVKRFENHKAQLKLQYE